MRIIMFLGFVVLALGVQPVRAAGAQTLASITTSEQATTRAAVFLHDMGWSSSEQLSVKVTPLPHTGAWLVDYLNTEQQQTKVIHLRLDARTHAVTEARNSQIRKNFHSVERATLTSETALKLATKYVRCAGGSLAGLRLVENQAVTDKVTKRVTSWTLRFQRAYQGYNLFGGETVLTLHPLNGTIFYMRVNIETPDMLPLKDPHTKFRCRVTQKQAEAIAARFLREKAKIWDEHVKTAKLYIVPLHLQVKKKKPEFRLAWVIDFTWDTSHWASAFVDADKGTVLYHNRCM